jgi:hypothetical protein
MALKRISTAELQRELVRREKTTKRLQARHKKLSAELASVEAELAELGTAAPARRRRKVTRGRRKTVGRKRKTGRKKKAGRKRKAGRKKAAGRKGTRRRARNKVPLPDALAAVVRPGTVVSPAEAAKRVRAKGFKTTSKHFGMMVAGALAKDKRFKRKGRGEYERQADK